MPIAGGVAAQLITAVPIAEGSLHSLDLVERSLRELPPWRGYPVSQRRDSVTSVALDATGVSGRTRRQHIGDQSVDSSAEGAVAKGEVVGKHAGVLPVDV